MKKDLYKTLGVSRQAKQRDIQRAYQKLARRLHPDVNPADDEAADKFREVQEAYKVLSRRLSREMYDQKGQTDHAAKPGAHRPEEAKGFSGTRGWESIIRDIFHDDPEVESQAGSTRGEDIHQVLEVAFEESLRGEKKTISYQREKVCPTCRGRRFEAGAALQDCPDCGGAGVVSVPTGPYTVKKICRRCSGTGQVSDQVCRLCVGKGRTLTTEKKTVRVAPGSDSGTRIVLAGQGQPGKRGAPSGDLVVTLRVKPHPELERRGFNLYSTVPVTVAEAALGATLVIPTAARKISLKIAPGTQSEQQIRLKGKGVPLPEGSKRGDFYVTVKVIVPAATDPRAIRLMRELERLFPENPREIEGGRTEK